MRTKSNNTSSFDRLTKREALVRIGVERASAHKQMGKVVDLARVGEGRKVLAKRDNFRTVIAGVSGSIEVTTANGASVQIDAPFVIDTWCADEQSLATIDVTTMTTCDLMLVNVEHRDAAFAVADNLAKHSHATVQCLFQAVDTSTPQTAIVSPDATAALAG